MIDLKKLMSIIQKREQDKNYPKHVIINLYPCKTTEEKFNENFTRMLNLISDIIDLQKEKNIPIITISLGKKSDIVEDLLFKFLNKILSKSIENKIKVTIFGKWYDLKGQLVEELKKLNNETSDFDHFFLNICINYDGKEEIVDASKYMIKKILLNKDDVENLTVESFKDNVYSSYFIPVDLTIEPDDRFRGTFLWDSCYSRFFSLNKKVVDITKSDISKALDRYAE